MVVADIFALICAMSGWFYLFYSKAATRLVAVESAQLNSRRIRLRRICGGAMFLLAVGFFAGFNTVDDKSPRAFLAVWLGVLLLLAIIILLVFVDVRLTRRIWHNMRGKDRS